MTPIKESPLRAEMNRKLRNQFRSNLDEGKLDIASAVKQMRRLSGLTQEEFAAHRRLSLPTLKKIEAGKANPTIATLNQIGEIFGLEMGFVSKRRSDP